VPQHPHAVQFRAAGDGGRDPRRLAAIRPQAQRFTQPSHANAAAFARAVDEVSAAARRLLGSLQTASPVKNREVEAMKARARAKERFAHSS